MNITLFKKYDNIFASDILHSYWVTPIEDASGLFSNWKDFSNYSEEELENLKFDVNPTTISIPNNEIINAYGMFTNNKLIRKVEMDFPNATNIGVMFASSSIEEIECDFSSVNENNGGAFAKCDKLKTVRCDFRNLEKRVMGAGPGYSPPDIDGLDRYGYGFSFNASPNLTTCECNFASLKNADNLLNKCSNLTTFNCELDSLESAVGLCPNAKLTLESVTNIAEKIKTHNPDETHRIDLGIDCPTASEYIFGWSNEVNKILAKNWNVGINLSNGSSITSTEYTNESIISAPETNIMNFTTGNQTSQQKYGFVMLSEDKNTIVNRIKIKTSTANNKTARLRVHDYNKKVIAISNPITISGAGEYIFEFDKPFILEKNIQTIVDDSNPNIINNVVNDRKYYLDFINENKTARTELKIVFCDVEKGYGAMWGDGFANDFRRQFSMEEDEHPEGNDGDSEVQRTIYSELWLENISYIILTDRVSDESPVSIIFTPSDDTTINSVVAHFKKAGESPMEDEAAPINITSTIINDGKSAQINMSKSNETGEYTAVIEIRGANEKTYYKSYTIVIE